MTARRVALIVPLLMFLGFVALAVYRMGEPQQRVIASKMVGQPVPAIDLVGMDEMHPGLNDSDLRQGTVTLVNLFASWCAPCRVEAPQLAALADKGVVIHGIAVRDTPENIAAFLKEHGDPFRRIGMDPNSKALLNLGASGLPETFLIDGKGIIRKQYIGQIRPEQVPEILKDIEEARRS
ncbi:MAG: DsbE family thiol:disulfide interchange protein [Sphingomonadaceae bacterium]|nr:DsbE family thiol:disulfide interchange protein [Sphingomonadaceae bacterium]